MHEIFWPLSPLVSDSPPTALVPKRTIEVLLATSSIGVPSVLNIERYSDAARLFRVTAWILRYVGKLRHREELQREIESTQIKERLPSDSPLRAIPVYIGDDGILRLTGRLQQSDKPYSFYELATTLTEIKAALNSTPLTNVYDEPGEPEPLYPSFLLTGRRLITQPSVLKPPTDDSGSLKPSGTDGVKSTWRNWGTCKAKNNAKENCWKGWSGSSPRRPATPTVVETRYDPEGVSGKRRQSTIMSAQDARRVNAQKTYTDITEAPAPFQETAKMNGEPRGKGAPP
ncbi:hypothetical protein HPB47_001675 [Ixodes persulcatus]|uniref:Uncharacterized protein n=1 Tax=Ixodes persulcatus TaxID=34615 RepID=A0AC60PNH5_IXOPE|nr:hypothetical protein HPB47_001675 [Ixodes persulcatus]